MNGMLSVNYPPIYRSFTKNFAFSTGLVPWSQMQSSIDNFRNSTGGNLTADSVTYLQNATLVYPSAANGSSITRRGLEYLALAMRDVSTSVGAPSSSSNSSSNSTSAPLHLVHGIQGYVEQLEIPQANTFMTVLLVLAIVIAAIAAGILLFKLILELWALFGSFPKNLTGFRKRYWGFLGRTIVNLILLLYGVWTLYCVYQLTHGDSWAAKLLAGITLAIFTAILAFFTFRIWVLARRYKKMEGDNSALYENKDTWRRYSLFYDQYKKSLWWIFIPAIVYMFARGCVIAAADGHGLVQTGGQLIIESLMLLLLVWSRPYVTKAGNVINIFIQVVRALSVVCILVFVEELGVSQSTKTITGVVLIVVQSVLTGLLGILIAVNAIIVCCRENPHRKKRKEAGKTRHGILTSDADAVPEKLNRDLDDLTPLDARNSLLIDPSNYPESRLKGPLVSEHPTTKAMHPITGRYRDHTPPRAHKRLDSQEKLVDSAAGMGQRRDISSDRESDVSFGSPPRRREPTPFRDYRGMAY